MPGGPEDGPGQVSGHLPGPVHLRERGVCHPAGADHAGQEGDLGRRDRDQDGRHEDQGQHRAVEEEAAGDEEDRGRVQERQRLTR